MSTFYFVIFAANDERRLDLIVEAHDAAQARRFWTRWRDANRHAMQTAGPEVYRIPKTTGRFRVLQLGRDIVSDMPAVRKPATETARFEVVPAPGDDRLAIVECRGPAPTWFRPRAPMRPRHAELWAAALNRALELGGGDT